MLIAFHKPYGVISQFTPNGSKSRTLAEFAFPKHVYPIGRLDADSEGLLLLSDEPELNERLLHPRHGHRRVYWAQVVKVTGVVTPEEYAQLETGLDIGRGEKSGPAVIKKLRETEKYSWFELTITEGKNRQVRRMTAAIGHPTLRLVRMRIGEFELGDLAAGRWKILNARERDLVLPPPRPPIPGGRSSASHLAPIRKWRRAEPRARSGKF